jgi:site-specific DNA-adenine methylase
MQYLGGKNRIAKHLLPIITSGWGTHYKTYVEPFVGGCGMFQQIPLLNGCTAIGYDKNPFLIKLLNYGKANINGENVTVDPEVQRDNGHLLSDFIDRDDYITLRKLARMNESERRSFGIPDEKIGFAGFIYSYRGDFFQGYSGYTESSMKAIQSYMKTIGLLRGKHLLNMSYDEIVLPDEPCIIYVDPPYIGERYVGLGFQAHWLELMDYQLLYETMRYWRALGHAVYLSERVAPVDFIPIWSQDVAMTMKQGGDWKNPDPRLVGNNTTKKPEILFTLL